jgi:hypothetical protein
VSRSLAWVLVVAAVGCSSGRMMQEPPIDRPVDTASGPPPPLMDDPQTTVDHAYADLVAKRHDLGLVAPKRNADETCSPVCTVEDPPAGPSHTAGCAAAAGSAGSTCAATCSAADATCDDAAKICAVAKQQNTEGSFAGRCHEAVATCTAATPLCCRCP